MDSRSAGVVVIAIGAIIIVGGLLRMSGGLSWLGRLPGDIRIERENVKVYIPIVSMLLVSLLLSAVIWVIRRLDMGGRRRFSTRRGTPDRGVSAGRSVTYVRVNPD